MMKMYKVVRLLIEVTTITNGLIKNWKILSESLEGNNHFSKATVNISKFKKSALKQEDSRLAVVPFRTADSVKVNKTVSKFEGAITAQLGKLFNSNKTFCSNLIGLFLAEQTKELNLIAAGSTTSMSVNEIVKLGNRLGTDYLIVGRIEKAIQLSQKKK